MIEAIENNVIEGISNPSIHIQFIKEEIEYLRKQIRPHDTGHIHTTISVLEHRVKELSEWVSS